MAKLTLSDAQALVKNKVLTEESLKEMQDAGMVSTRTRNAKRYMKTADGADVSPTLYFRGLRGHQESPKMVELRNEVNKIIEKYTKPIKNGS
tara:strand:+ start:3687 stop:3962 length:276 start_codon:yes stop_codon:yes gene_type:complete